MKPLSTPTKVYQDDFTPAQGNALQAAVASIFGLSLQDVPNFIVMKEGYEQSIVNFYLQHGRCAKIKLGIDNSKVPEAYDNQICILRGKSPRGSFGHVIVAKHTHSGQFEMLHDPHPDETFLDEESEAFGWCLFFVPNCLTPKVPPWDDLTSVPPVYIMSRYHPSTHSTDRELTPAKVLKLSSGDCRDLIDTPESPKAKQLLKSINTAPYCKITFGATISLRLQHIAQVIEKHHQLKDQNKLYCATPFEEAHSTAVSCKAHYDVKYAMVMVAFGGSCLHVLTVNQDKSNNILPGPNAVSVGLPDKLKELMVNKSELVGTPDKWLQGHEPPLPPDGTFYTTFPLDGDLNKSQYTLIARLFEELNALLCMAKGSYLFCGAPTNINPNKGEWWPDKHPRSVQSTLFEMARHSALPQVKNIETGINHGGLLSDRHKVTVNEKDTTVHEMVLSAMAAPKLVIDGNCSDSLPAIGAAMDYLR